MVTESRKALQNEHDDWDHEFFENSPGIIDRWEFWIDEQLKKGTSIQHIRHELDTANQTKRIHGASDFIQHMIDHAVVRVEKEAELERKRIQQFRQRAAKT